MRTLEPGRGLSPRLRLQIVLLLLIAWDLLALVAEATFGGPMFKVSDGRIGGLVGARGGLGGAAVVPLVLYAYALVRGPQRYSGLLWVGVLEQAVIVLMSLYHVAVGDLKVEAMVLPLTVSAVLFFLLLVNMPRGQTTS